MKKDTEETKVIFKMARYPDGERDIVAFFPEASANSCRILCYSHYGQHGEASDEFYTTRCKNATPKQYAPLKKELEVLCGYRLRVVKRISRKDRNLAWRLSTQEGEREIVKYQKEHAVMNGEQATARDNGYLVLQSETCDGDGELWTAATRFSRIEDARKFLKKVINDEWGTMKLEFPDGITRDVKLGDNPGYKYPAGSSIKRSLVFFDEDGDEAWDILGWTKKKLKIVKAGNEGERTC